MKKPTAEQLAALNVRIAALMGYRVPPHCVTKRRMTGEKRISAGACPNFAVKGDTGIARLDGHFTGSLDAIHEAENLLLTTPRQWEAYLDEALPEICDGEIATECAEAWQRAVALERAAC